MPREDTQFKTGNKAGKGRKGGSKNRITKVFLKDLLEIYLEGGKKALKRLCEERPDAFLKLPAALIPKDLDIKQSGDVSVRLVRYADEPTVGNDDEQDDDEET